MRARGGVLHYHLPNTSTPLSSLANTSRGRVFPYHLLPPTHPPRPQTRAGGWGFALPPTYHHQPTLLARKRRWDLPYHLPTTSTPPSSLANARRGWNFALQSTYHLQPTLLAHKCEPGGGVLPYHPPTTTNPPSSHANGGGICLTTYLQPPPHPPCPQTRAEGGFCLTIYLPPPPHPQPPPHPPRSQTRAEGVLPYHLPTTSTPPSSLANTSRGLGLALPLAYHYQPTLLARKHEPRVGFCLTTYLPPPAHPPRSQTRTEGGVLPYHLPTTSTPPSSPAPTCTTTPPTSTSLPTGPNTHETGWTNRLQHSWNKKESPTPMKQGSLPMKRAQMMGAANTNTSSNGLLLLFGP